MRQLGSWVGTYALVSVLLAAPTAHAALPCNGTVVAIGGYVSDERLYIDDRGQDGIWFYLEDNDRGGLQSGGSLFVITDTCRQGNDPDRLIGTFPLGI